ncbi:dCTP deaminase [Candidatus Nomurabacteria bacterium]|nr:dCTP deaminase [Candidatus Nomurabacteria bacterium]USN94608.1 MAG: dCTP deaminase [Candidatus Nomurabacteria bacterium]
MILTDKKIKEEIESGSIIIEPFIPENLGTNSYDVRLSEYLAIYKSAILDAKEKNEIEHLTIPDDGFIIHPGTLYLGTTIEYTETHAHVPFLEGKSSVGRLGIDIHATAGKGDVGFEGFWTLEISCTQPVKIYAGMPIGQLIYFEISGEVENSYNKKKSAKYINEDPRPMGSMMYKNFPLK